MAVYSEDHKKRYELYVINKNFGGEGHGTYS
jgi:hypothetical protein